MYLPFSARLALLVAIICNTVLSIVYENWGTPAVAGLIDFGYYIFHQGREKGIGKPLAFSARDFHARNQSVTAKGLAQR